MVKNVGLSELIKQASAPFSRTPQRLREPPVTLAKELQLELEALLHLRDGFTAADGSLIVRPSVTVAAIRGVDDWNQLSLWRTPYRHASELYFFAEDITGHQYALYREEVVSFDPETGKFEHCSFGLDRWAELVLADPDDVGASIKSDYESVHGPLSPTQRLQPTIPFILAESEDTSFRPLEDLDLMKRYARLFTETTKLEDGATAEIDWWLEE